MTTNADYLKQASIFAKLDASSLEKLAAACQRRRLAKDEPLFHEGDPGDALYVIAGGTIRIERIGDGGQVQILGMRHAGEVLGEMSLISQEPRSAQAVAHTACRLLILHRQTFVDFLLSDPGVSLAIMQTLSARIQESGQMLLDRRSKEVPERLLAYLESLPRDDGGNVRLGMTQSALADLLGCTREAINRGLTELEERRLLRKHGRNAFELLR